MNYKQLKARWKRRRQKIVRLHDEQGMSFAEIAKAIQEPGKPVVTRQQVHKLYWDEKERTPNEDYLGY